VALQLAIGREGIGLELARPVHFGCLVVTELAAGLPGLRFPVDVSGGVPRFRHRRGELRHVQIELTARALERWVAPRLRGVVGWRAPEVWVGASKTGASICISAGPAPPEEAATAAPAPVLAFELCLLADGEDIVLVVERPRGSELPAPAAVLAIGCMEAALAGCRGRDEQSGAVFALRRPAEALVRSLLPEAGARAPSAEDVRWMSLSAHGDMWILHAARGALPSAPSEAALRAREVAWLLRPGDELLIKGDLHAARLEYLRELERAPRHPEVALRIADLDARAGGRAEAALAVLSEVYGAEPRVRSLHGELLAEIGDREGALAALERAGEAEPAPALAARALELAARNTGDAEQAGRWLDRAVARAPRAASARWMRLQNRVMLGRLEEALADAEHLEALARGARGKHCVWMRAAHAWTQAGLGGRVAPLFERALRYAPDDPGALAGLGAGLVDEGRVPRGIAVLTRALSIAERTGGPTSKILLDLATALAERLDDLPSAIARVSAIGAEAAEAPTARGLEGRWRARLGDLAGAGLAFARLRDLAASHAPGPEGQAAAIAALLLEGAEFARVRMGDSLTAQRHLAAALRLRPLDPELRRVYREIGARIAGVSTARVSDPLSTRAAGLPDRGAAEMPRLDEHEAAAAAQVDELTRRLQADPRDDAAADELAIRLEALGRGHELLALLSARLEDAPPERRAELAGRTRVAFQRLAREAEAAGRSEEAALYRTAIAAL
jgi:tetratricopeptide (TPR) repeat protein